VEPVIRLVLALVLMVGVASGAASQHKVFLYHLAAAPDVLDPAKCNNVRCQRVMWAIYEPLVNLSRDLRTVLPGLAESWEASADGLTYTFHLRRGVTFHDGSRFNATAAKLNLERNFLPQSRFYTTMPPNVREKILIGLIREINVKDEHTLTVALKNRKMNLLFLVPMVSPEALAKHGSAVGEHPAGTGPFRFVRSSADEIRLAANPAYWGGRPRLDELSFRIIPQAERMSREFLSGRLDFLPDVEPLYVERIVANPNTKLIRLPTLSLYYLGLRTDRKPFDDVRVRQALTRAIDVDRAVLFTLRGTGIPAYGALPPEAEAYDPAIKRAGYQPEIARRLLTESGITNNLRLSLVFNVEWQYFAELAQAMRADLAKVGITVDLIPTSSWKELVDEVRKGKGDMFIYSWLIPIADADAWLTPLFQSKSVDNLTRYTGVTVDRLLEQAKSTVNDGDRLELYRKAQRVIVDEAPMVFLFHKVRVSAYNSRVVGLELNTQSYPLDRFAQIDVRTE
jgi:peptide/nickel transport system substrate-binding protein